MLKRWLEFYKERCAGHAVGLASSAFATDLIVQRLLGANVILHQETFLTIGTIVLMGGAFRCSDELRDLDTDLKYFPTRPLAAGRISPREVKLLATTLVVTALILNLIWPFAPAPLFLSAGFLLLIHHWYFLPGIIPNNRFYAVLANLPFLYTLYLYVALAMLEHHGFPNNTWIPYAVAGWMVIPLHTYEFARKVVPQGQEREGYQTYSAMMGPRPAAWLAFSTAAIHFALAAAWAPARELYGAWLWVLATVLIYYFGVTLFFTTNQGRRFKQPARQAFFEQGLGQTAGIYGMASRVFSVLSAFRFF